MPFTRHTMTMLFGVLLGFGAVLLLLTLRPRESTGGPGSGGPQVSTGQPGGDAPPAGATPRPDNGQRPGNPWTGVSIGRTPHTQAALEAQDDPPAFWFGPQFAGYHLTRVQPGPELQLIYGDCDLRFVPGCSYPAVIQVKSACGRMPGDLVDLVKSGDGEIVRGGALLVRYQDRSARLYTGRWHIALFTDFDRGRRMDEAVQQLHGLSHSVAHLGPGDPLPPPDWSGCPPPTGGVRTSW